MRCKLLYYQFFKITTASGSNIKVSFHNKRDQHFMNQFDLPKAITLIGLAGGVYLCYLTSAVFHQKLLKHSYQSTSGQSERITDSMMLSFYPTLAATIIGFFVTSCQKQSVYIPPKKSIIVAVILLINQYTYNQAVVYASFPSVVMVKSCSLLSVILVAVFCSKVKDKNLKLGPQKIIIGILACTGIIFFNYFAKSVDKNEADHPISSISTILLLISLIGDGFMSDYQAEIKASCKPSSYDMFYNVNKWTFLCCTLVLAVRFQLINVIMFPINHPQFGKDVAILSFINGIGQLFIYEMIKQFKQHIPAFVIAIRKCLTVIINIIWFGHEVNPMQMIGLICVILAVMAQVCTNNCRKKTEEQHQAKEGSSLANQLDEKQDLLSKINDQLNQNVAGNYNRNNDAANHLNQPQQKYLISSNSNNKQKLESNNQSIRKSSDNIEDLIQKELMQGKE